MTPDERIAQLEAENACQREQIAVLVARVQEREARVAKDSYNSGKPPSRDGLARKTKRLRCKSGKRPGGQLGRRGMPLHLVATPATVVEPRPTICAGCQHPLDADAPVVRRERRQVHALPSLRLVVQEDQALHVRCPACRTVRVGAFPASAPSRAQDGPRLRALVVSLVEQQLVPYGRVQELLADWFGAHLSLGALVQWVRHGAATLAPVEAQIKAALGRAAVLQSDETGVRQAGHLAGAHVACTDRLTWSTGAAARRAAWQVPAAPERRWGIRGAAVGRSRRWCRRLRATRRR